MFSLCEVCLCIYFVWMKEGPRMCWVVSGHGKTLGWMFLFPQVSEMPNTLGIIYVSETLWHVWGKIFLFPQVSEMSNTLGIISHRILQQRWGNVLAFQTYLQRQGSSEELYIGSRVHPNKTLSPKNQTEKPFRITSGDNYRKYHKELGRVCNQYFHGGCYKCFV